MDFSPASATEFIYNSGQATYIISFLHVHRANLEPQDLDV